MHAVYVRRRALINRTRSGADPSPSLQAANRGETVECSVQDGESLLEEFFHGRRGGGIARMIRHPQEVQDQTQCALVLIESSGLEPQLHVRAGHHPGHVAAAINGIKD